MRHPVLPRIALAATLLSLPAPARTAPPSDTPAPPAEASQFDFLVGTWEIDVAPNIPGVPERVRGRWTAQKSADGFMVVDEYRIFDDGGATAYLGETYRVYNAAAKRWEFRYVEPFSGTWHEGTGVKEGAEMHLMQKNVRPDGSVSLLKIRYYDISPNAFRWSSERSTDGGKTWSAGGRIEATRAR